MTNIEAIQHLQRELEQLDPEDAPYKAIAFAIEAINRVHNTLSMAIQYGQFDGEHHKAWAIDQMVRRLTGDQYNSVVAEACDGDDGPDSYTWELGIPP